MAKLTPKIAVVGLGYVGLPLAVRAAEVGYEVVGIDINDKKIGPIKQGKTPFKDSKLQKKLKEEKLEVTKEFSASSKAGIIVICVPTPVFENRLPDYGPVKEACKAIAPHIAKGYLSYWSLLSILACVTRSLYLSWSNIQV